MIPPSYDLRSCSIDVVAELVAKYHSYGSIGANATYAFAVYEDDKAVAAYVWQPPPPGSAKSVCPEEPSGVLALSRMVAVPKDERRLAHVSKPLRRQMRVLIDRGRWPVLVTYSDEGQGHTGHVYKCSGWRATVRSKRPFYLDVEGRRASSYSNGSHGLRNLVRGGTTTIQRWEHRACPEGKADRWMKKHGWRRVRLPDRVWRSGNPAYTWKYRRPKAKKKKTR